MFTDDMLYTYGFYLNVINVFNGVIFNILINHIIMLIDEWLNVFLVTWLTVLFIFFSPFNYPSKGNMVIIII
jgi:hypothetical protein